MNEPDILDILAASFDDLAPSSRVATPLVTAQDTGSEPHLITLDIERDLAIMLIGSNAGSKGRIKPHASMTEGAHPQQTIDVSSLLEPILRDEIRRLTSDKNHSPRRFTVGATPGQAASLKAFCVRYAAYIRKHLEEASPGDRAHRSGQRLRQAYHLIDQVNSALGIAYDDGRTLEQCRKELDGQVVGLQAALEAYRARLAVEDPDRPAPRLEGLFAAPASTRAILVMNDRGGTLCHRLASGTDARPASRRPLPPAGARDPDTDPT